MATVAVRGKTVAERTSEKTRSIDGALFIPPSGVLYFDAVQLLLYGDSRRCLITAANWARSPCAQ
jgi:hypothetical protein